MKKCLVLFLPSLPVVTKIYTIIIHNLYIILFLANYAYTISKIGEIMVDLNKPKHQFKQNLALV